MNAKVVHIITRLIRGGAQLTALETCRALRDEWGMQLVSGPETGTEGSLHDEARAAVPVTVVQSLRRELSPGADARAVRELRGVLRELRPDLIHTHSSKAGIIGRLAVDRASTAVVHSIHGWGHTPADAPARRATLIAAERLMARRTDALVAVSSDVRDEGLRRGIGRREQYHVIPEAVDLSPRGDDFTAHRQAARRMLGISGDGQIVGWVGRFAPQKDPDALVSVIATLLRDRGALRAVLVGDGPDGPRVRRALEAHGVADRVLFAGLRADARDLYSAFDVLVHPSLWEGQPRVPQEALAERVPVVASRVQGIAELIVDGLNGYAAAPGDAGEMSRATAAVLDAPAMQPPLAPSACEHLRHVAGADIAMAAHRELYRRLLGS